MKPSLRILAELGPLERLALSAALGAASSFSFAPYFIWPLMIVAVCGLVWLLDAGSGGRHAAACGWFFGLGHFSLGLYWISISFEFQANMPAWLGWAAVGALAGYLSLYPALALWVSSKVWSKSPARIVIFAAFWTTTEWLRGHLLTGFPWNTVAQIWANTPILLQSARLFGSYGLSLLTVTVFASAMLALDKRRSARWGLLLAMFLAVAALIDGSWRLAAPTPARGEPLRVHLVQANIRQDLETDPERQHGILQLYEKLTADAIRLRGPGVVIWPETALEYDVEGEAQLRSRLVQSLQGNGPLILGAVGQRYGSDGVWRGSRNSLVVIAGNGAVQAVYDKAKLVPFGEYLPAGKFLSKVGLVSVAGGSARFIPGNGPATVAVAGLPPFGPLICYEIIFAGEVVQRSARPTWLLNISNDAWFGLSSGPHQHLAQARIRAVEEGLPVVRSTPTGISAVIDAYGRVRARSALGERTVITADVPGALGPTPYGRGGDWLLMALLSAWALLGASFMRMTGSRDVKGDAVARG